MKEGYKRLLWLERKSRKSLWALRAAPCLRTQSKYGHSVKKPVVSYSHTSSTTFCYFYSFKKEIYEELGILPTILCMWQGSFLVNFLTVKVSNVT